MDATGIVEVLNNKFEHMGCTKGVHFVLQKYILDNKPFKAYKTYTYRLWYINKRKQYIIGEIKHTNREVSDAEKKSNIKYMDSQLLIKVFSILMDNINLNLMLKGEFQGYGIIDKNE